MLRGKEAGLPFSPAFLDTPDGMCINSSMSRPPPLRALSTLSALTAVSARFAIPALILGMIPAVILAGAALGFSLIPRLLGDKVGATFSGYSNTELLLCGLDPHGRIPILVGGDSRAKLQVIPAVVKEVTGRECLNIAETLPFGGDITTLANSLRKNPGALAIHPILVVSVSMLDVDDLNFADAASAMAFNWSPADHARVLAREPAAYGRHLLGRFLPAVKREAVRGVRGTGFTCPDSGIHIAPYLAGSMGYYFNDSGRLPGRFREEEEGRRSYLIEGGNWKSFRKSLAWLAQSQAGPILLYNAPYNPKWLREWPGSRLRKAETRFSAMVSELVQGNPRVTFLDFHRHPVPEIDSTCFIDRSHLNARGSALFSRILADSIRARL